MRKILIIGATSAIAEATARLFASRGDALYLVGRNISKLQIIADDLKVRGASQVSVFQMDANEFDRHQALLDQAENTLGGLDTVLIAHGVLSDQHACQESVDVLLSEIKTNALSCMALLTLIANRFEQNKAGCIAVICSVSGDRGRQSNYVYGSAKAMLSTFLSGLRQRLAKSNVTVITIKPGFVDTPMTKAFKKGLLWVGPEVVAQNIVTAIDKKTLILYTPWFWKVIMAVIKAIPERIFVRIKL